jgi:uncharacterized lipoprotein YmbA
VRLVFLTLLLLSACSSPPRERFYTLDAPEPPAAADAALSIAVGPVTIPELVDRPQFVVRLGANQVSITEQARWAEPLKSAIARVVAANLASALSARAVSQRSAEADYRVALDVQRFDSGPGDSVLIDAASTVVSSKGPRLSGRSVVQEKLKAMEYGAVAAGHSAALAAISREIAAAIRKP